MREVEVKARIRDSDALIRKLQSEGVALGEKRTQVDSIFVPIPLRLIDTKGQQFPILRIREEASRITLTLKRDVSDQLDSIEHEVQIDDVKEGMALLNELGYHKVVTVEKSRLTGIWRNNKICVDEVRGIGSFVELEFTSDDEVDSDKIREQMWQLLSEVGVSQEDAVATGYDRMVELQKQKEDKEI